MDWDVFICHANEDKQFVNELALALKTYGLRVWYDSFCLSIGDSLRQSIDKGLSCSDYGVVVLSNYFFAKNWTQYELNGLIERDLERKVILPIWHNISREDLLKVSPSLADKVAVSSAISMKQITDAILFAISQSRPKNQETTHRRDNIHYINNDEPRLDILRDLPITEEEDLQ